MPSVKAPLDRSLYDILMENLAKLADYLRGPVKRAGGTRDHVLHRYQSDPVFSIFELDSVEHLAATLAGFRFGAMVHQCHG